ncbi:peptidyl-prolyl cis-trans isomerase [Streptococcus zalophi]|uniref:peptidyl-prolyl cis-trans isomerase n=1 Tax=Streptococcus zalophi TaxID=640031 RepID=UPI00215CA00C|nr:peptidyl-prolyl cis-trans isomerase [Streptococcus zalophi]MCR8967866.1 peptidyl-prolyl cis-trans isomerase [Streptococcus zalophi]
MKKRLFATGLVTLLSVVTLAACSTSKDADAKLATMKGDTITLSDFYNEVKSSTAAQQTMVTLILERVFEDQYGDKVSDKEVTDAYNENAKQYGDQFEQALAQAGTTAEQYKKTIRLEKLLEYAINKAAEKELNDDAYKMAYETYTPETTAQVIVLDSEEAANATLEEVRAEGADFAKIAQEKSMDKDNIEVSFDSADNKVLPDVMKTAFALDVNGISGVVPIVDTSTYRTNYYIVKTTKKAEKDADWKTYEKRLKEMFLSQKSNDPAFRNVVISEALDKANVKIKDDSFANVLSQFTPTDASQSNENKESDDKKSEEDKKSDDK